MCLLIVTTPETKFTAADHNDYFSSNADGLGVMVADNGTITVHKILPNNVAEIVEFLKPFEGKAVAMHYRMATHGNIDLAQCHPYLLLDADSGHEMWLMHNGVLSHGNDLDKTKSDTYQYIETHLRPLLDPRLGGNPELIFNEVFQDILGDSIGSSNKFVVMDGSGRIATINKSSGVKHNAAWYSNTYAWDSNAAGFGYKSTFKGSSSYWGKSVYGTGRGSFDYGYDNGGDETWNGHTITKKTPELIGLDPVSDTDEEIEWEATMKEAEEIMTELDWCGHDGLVRDLEVADLAAFIYTNGTDALYDAIEHLNDLRSDVSEDDVYTYIINGSTSKVLSGVH